MTTLTLSDITAPPAGYSFHVVDGINGYGAADNRCFWFASKSVEWGHNVRSLSLRAALHPPAFFKRDENGAIVFDQSAFDAQAAANEHVVDGSYRPVPDSEFPEGGMTRYHTHFNEVSKKWELPYIDAEIHARHERNHDSDVASAVAEICDVKVKLMMREAMLVNLNPDQQAKAKAKLTDFDNCIEEIVDANAEPDMEHAWLKSFGGIPHPKVSSPYVPFIDAAHAFANAYINLINSKTTGQLVARRYQYTLCLRDALLADRGKTGSARFLPKGVILVKTKSTPANKAEITETALFNKLKARIVPVEGAPKTPV